MSSNKKGFSLIELLLVISFIMVFLISSFFIYQKVSLNNTVKSISNDMSYSITEYKRMLIYPSTYFSNKKGCCDMSPAIHSNFKLVKEEPNNTIAQKYYAFNGYSIIIGAHEYYRADSSGPSSSNTSYLFYKIYFNGNTELCTNIIMDNIQKFSYIYIDKQTFVGGLHEDYHIDKATLKKISETCDNASDVTFFSYSID